MQRTLLLLIVVAFIPRAAAAQGDPVGPEFRVNTYTTGIQHEPSVALDAAGNFVVLWESSGQDGSLSGIFAQRYDGAGSPLGGEFRVNTYTTSSQSRPSAAHDSAGNFVVVWQSSGQDGMEEGIFAQRYASTGAPLGGEFRVNARTWSSQGDPGVASDPAGNIVVVWQGSGHESSSGPDIFAQRYDSAGNRLGGEFRVNTYTTYSQGRARVASDAAGNFVVVWIRSSQQGSNSDVFARRYASTGIPLGPDFRVNTYTTSTQNWPSVACDSTGNFVVTWYGYTPGGSGFDVVAQRYASTGMPLGGEFRVNSYVTSAQWFPTVASDPAGNFVVAWDSYFDQDGWYEGIYAQRFSTTGTPVGGEFRVNTYTTRQQVSPSVASDSSGNFVVVWSSYTQDGNHYGVFGQRYELMHFRVE
jgi:hypothetical protein